MDALGPYDAGYRCCPCFWGTAPGSFVRKLVDRMDNARGLRVLDLGAGEGKNSVYLSRMGALVDAIEISPRANENAEQLVSDTDRINWIVGDVRRVTLEPNAYDIVIAYGLFHCLAAPDEIQQLASAAQKATRDRGWNVICSFNARSQDLSAHPGFEPCLVEHQFYVDLYQDWQIVEQSDSDLQETHPHNGIPHTHSMTRLIARKG